MRCDCAVSPLRRERHEPTTSHGAMRRFGEARLRGKRRVGYRSAPAADESGGRPLSPLPYLGARLPLLQTNPLGACRLVSPSPPCLGQRRAVLMSQRSSGLGYFDGGGGSPLSPLASLGARRPLLPPAPLGARLPVSPTSPTSASAAPHRLVSSPCPAFCVLLVPSTSRLPFLLVCKT